MPELRTGAHPAVAPRLIRTEPGWEDRPSYERAGGYRPGPAGPDLIEAVDRAGLRGRGGAAFPLARKLAAVAAQPGQHTVLVNGEEGEPASVKDRWLLRTRPHLVLDGALRAASAVGASAIHVYVSDAEAAGSVKAALAELESAAIDLVQVEPSYVAGEETAAVNALRGRPAKPSDKPPRPFEEGILVSNAETLANLPAIAAGDHTAGTFLLTLSGAVPHPGLYEVPFGVTVGEVTRTLGGYEETPRGYLMGGYFAGLLNPRGADLPLDYDALRGEGTGLGCGAITVLGDGDCPVGAAARLLSYFGRENAGQCGSCFNGTAAMAGTAVGLARGEAGEEDLQRLGHWSRYLRGRGACATLDGAASVAATVLREFAGDVREHMIRSCESCRSADFDSPAAPFAVDPSPLWRASL